MFDSVWFRRMRGYEFRDLFKSLCIDHYGFDIIFDREILPFHSDLWYVMVKI